VTTRDWDASTYERVSDPQVEWALRVLDRLPLRGDETVLDAGCGTGNVTRVLLERLPRGRVIAVDAAPSMVEQARALLPADVDVFRADLLDLTLEEPVDAILSTATFHWIRDHERLFARLHAALKPGGRLVAQCGGEGNVVRFRARADAVAQREPYAAHLADWSGPWNYASPEDTTERLRNAGFTDISTWLQPWDTTPPEPEQFLRSVCLHPHIERLPPELHDAYIADVLAECGDPFVLDYVRLNIDARRPDHSDGNTTQSST
jgi:trans-aconitate 2-methyltransferase